MLRRSPQGKHRRHAKRELFRLCGAAKNRQPASVVLNYADSLFSDCIRIWFRLRTMSLSALKLHNSTTRRSSAPSTSKSSPGCRATRMRVDEYPPPEGEESNTTAFTKQ